MDSLQTLIAMCQMKNDLNRKRRRCWYWMHNNKASSWSRDEDSEAHRETQAQMKAMTPVMRKMRVALGVSLCWNQGGMISYVLIDGKYIHHKDFKKYYNNEMFEQIVLGK